MQGLYYHKTTDGQYTTLSLIRFYEDSGYVIVRTETGDKPYLTKILKNFVIAGLDVKCDPEYTFCGANMSAGNAIKFKVENRIPNTGDTWAEKDMLTFAGTLNGTGELHLIQISKRTGYAVERVYIKTTDEDLMNAL